MRTEMPPKTGQFGQQSRSTFSRSRGRGDDTRSRRRRRRCCVTLIITGSRFGRRCCLGTAFIVCRSAITSVCDRDIGVEGTFRTASGMGARRRGDHYRTSLWVAPSLDVGRIVFFREWLLEILDHYHRRGRALSRSQSAWPPPSSNSVTLLLPHTHVLTRGAALPPGAVIITTTATRRPAVVPTLWRLLPRRCTQ